MSDTGEMPRGTVARTFLQSARPTAESSPERDRRQCVAGRAGVEYEEVTQRRTRTARPRAFGTEESRERSVALWRISGLPERTSRRR